MCIYSAIIKNHKLCDLCEPYTMGLVSVFDVN